MCVGKTVERELSNIAWLNEEEGNLHHPAANLKEGSDFSLFWGLCSSYYKGLT